MNTQILHTHVKNKTESEVYLKPKFDIVIIRKIQMTDMH